MSNFSDILKSLLNKNHISQRQLADELGLTTASISRYCSGEQYPRGEILKNIAEFFHVPVDYLIGTDTSLIQPEKNRYYSAINDFSDISAPGDDNMIKIFRLAKTLDQEHLETVYDFIGYLLSKKADTSEDNN